MFVFIKADVFEPESHCERPFQMLHEAIRNARAEVALHSPTMKNEDVDITWNTDRFMVSVNGDLQGVIVELDDAV